MKNVNLACLGLVALSAALLAGCGNTHGMSNHDKNTNWLMSCSEAQPCGSGLTCVCGVCTSSCGEAAECSALGADAVCETLAAGGNSCSGRERTATVCTLSCESDSMCSDRNDELTCVADRCVPEPGRPMAGQDGGSDDASMPHMDARVDDADVPNPGPDSGSSGDATVTDAPWTDAPSNPDGGADVVACEEADFHCDAVANDIGSLLSLAAGDDGYLYWADWGTRDALENHRSDGAIQRMSGDGGSLETVVGGLRQPVMVWPDADRVYFLTGGGSSYANEGDLLSLYDALLEPNADEDAGVEAGEPRLLATRFFGPMRVEGSAAAWTAQSQLPDESNVTHLFRWNLRDAPTTGPRAVTIPNIRYTVFAAEPAMGTTYLEDGHSSLLRFPSSFEATPTELLIGWSGVSSLSLIGDRFWLMHSSEGRRWLSFMPKAGGLITHVAELEHNRLERPIAGATVIWFVTHNSSGHSYRLWTYSPTTGDVELAAVWPRLGTQYPHWTARGDAAWFYLDGMITRVTPR